MERKFQPEGDRCEKVAGTNEKSAVHKIKQGLTACLFHDTICKLDFSVGRGLFFMPYFKNNGGGSCAHKNHIRMYRM